jgi:hypothetical protein
VKQWQPNGTSPKTATLPASLSISGTTAAGSENGTRGCARWSAPVDQSSSAPTPAMPSLFGESTSTRHDPERKKELNAALFRNETSQSFV